MKKKTTHRIFSRLFLTSAFAAGVTIILGFFATAAEFNVAGDFQTNSNPNGVWSYGWKHTLGGVFTKFTHLHTSYGDNGGGPIQIIDFADFTPPEIYYNAGTNTATSDGGQAQYPPGTLWMIAGVNGSAQNYGVIRFTAPSNNVYNVGVAVRSYLDAPFAGDVDFYVVRNNADLQGWFIPGPGSANYTNLVALATGDTLDFVVGRGADDNLNASGLKIQALISTTTNSLPPGFTNPPPPVYSDFNLSRDFTTNINPNGVWSYGWKQALSSNLNLYTRNHYGVAGNGVPIQVIDSVDQVLPEIYFNGTTNTAITDGGQGNFPPGTVWYLAGNNGAPENFGTIRFTAPSNSNYRIGVAVRAHLDSALSGDTDFHVVKNGVEVFGAFLPSQGGTNYTNILTLAAGDRIDFAVGRGADNNVSASALKIAVLIAPTTNTPPPPPPPVYSDFNISRDFSTNTNPNGVWSYGWKQALSSNLNLYTHNHVGISGNGVPIQIIDAVDQALPEIYFNGTTNTAVTDGGQGQFPPGTVWYLAGNNGAPENFGTIRFTAPSNSNYNIGVAVRAHLDSALSGDTDFHVVKNGVEIFGAFLPSRGATNYTNTVTLATGDRIDFAIGRGADNNVSGSALKIAALITPTTNTPPPPPPVYSDFNAARDFSTNTNPNGVWSYGAQQAVGSAFSLMTRVRTVAGTVPYNVRELTPGGIPDIMHYPWSNPIAATNGNSVFPPGTLLLHPGASGGTQNLAVLRFTTPSNGNYRIEASANPAYDGTPQGDTDYHVAKNGQELFGAFLNPADRVGYTNIVSLSVGDTLDFAVGRGADNSEYGSFLKIQAIITPTTNSPAVTNPPPPVYSDFNLSRDFTTNINPNGVWSYGWKQALSSNLNLYTHNHFGVSGNGVPIQVIDSVDQVLPEIYFNGTTNAAITDGGQGNFPPGTVWYLAGNNGAPENFGTIRFTAPSNSNYRIGVAVRAHLDGPASGDTDFHVVKNGVEMFGAFLPSQGGTNYTNILTLAAGDRIDFAIGRGADNNVSGSALKIAVLIAPTTNTPPPPPPPVYSDFNISRDFSTNTNPDGVWSYGWKENVTGALSLFVHARRAAHTNGVPYDVREYTPYGLPVVMHHPLSNTEDGLSAGTGRFPPGTVLLVPGTGAPANFCAVRFTAPSNSNYRVETSARPCFDGAPQGDTDFHITLNDIQVLGQFLTPAQSTGWTNVIALQAGQTVDFMVGRGADGDSSGSIQKFAAVITPTTDPVTFVTNPPPPVVYSDFDVSRDFRTNSNPDGVWSYGWKQTLAGTLTLFAHTRRAAHTNGVAYDLREYAPYATPLVMHHPVSNTQDGLSAGTGHFPPGTVLLNPGASSPANYCVVRFTAPSNGNYRVGTTARPCFDGPPQGDTDFHVVLDGIELFNRFLAPNQSAEWTNVVTLNAGQSLDFIVGRGADNIESGSIQKFAALITPTSDAPTIGTNPPPPPPTVEFRASQDFSTNTNPNGVWSYGAKSNVSGALSLFAYTRRATHANGVPYDIREYAPSTGPLLMHHPLTNTADGLSSGTGHFPPGTILLVPGSGSPQFSVIRFTAPTNGTYRVETSARPGFDGPPQGDTDFHVVVNGTEVLGQFLATTQSIAWSNVLSLAAGATVDFVVGRGADNSDYGSIQKVIANVTSVPSAPSLAAKAATGSSIKLDIVGDIGGLFVIEASSDLSTWIPLLTVLNTSGTVQFTDPEAGAYSSRFYRARPVNP